MEEALDLLKHYKRKLLAVITGKGPISVSITMLVCEPPEAY